MTIKSKLLKTLLNNRAGKCGIFILIDPEKVTAESIPEFVKYFSSKNIDAFLIGGSTMEVDHFKSIVSIIRKNTKLPIIFFPGTAQQITADGNGILFMSLISGRNPKYLIEEQVKGAPVAKAAGLEAIGCGYMVISSRNKTKVEKVSKTNALNRDNILEAVNHALAAQYMGMETVYLECGSGAVQTVPEEMIKGIKRECDLVLIVGGGIRDAETAKEKADAGADFIVIGTLFEDKNSYQLIDKIFDSINR